MINNYRKPQNSRLYQMAKIRESLGHPSPPAVTNLQLNTGIVTDTESHLDALHMDPLHIQPSEKVIDTDDTKKIMTAIETIKDTLQAIKVIQDEHNEVIRKSDSSNTLSDLPPIHQTNTSPVLWCSTLCDLDIYIDKSLTKLSTHRYKPYEIIQVQNPEEKNGTLIFETFFFMNHNVQRGYIVGLTEEDEYINNLSLSPLVPTHQESLEI